MTADHMDAPDTIPVAPAEAATAIGADYDGTAGFNGYIDAVSMSQNDMA